MAGSEHKVTLVAVGDAVAKKIEHPEKVFDLTRSILKGADITFGQLECCFSLPGGTAVGPSPSQYAKILAEAGFNIMSCASNHSMDWGAEVMLHTKDVMQKANIAVMGTGKNIEEASKPIILERKGMKIGFLSYCSVTKYECEATAVRPGVATVRANTAYEPFDYQPGTPPLVVSKANPGDLAALLENIKKLRSPVDILVLSMHWGVHFLPALIASYQREIGHAAIDAGVDLILGHHAHILKGIEVYKGKVIFYSLANFSMNPLRFEMNPPPTIIDPHPAMIENYAGHRWATKLGHRLELDTNYTEVAMPFNYQKSIMVKCTMSGKKIDRITFLPLWLNQQEIIEPLSRSDPRSNQVFEYMEWVCGQESLDTKFTRDGDEFVLVT